MFSLVCALGLGVVAALLVLIVAIGYWSHTIDVDGLKTRVSFHPKTLVDGVQIEIGQAHESYCDVVTLPGFLVLLLLLHEDDLFFAHRGVNSREICHRVKAFLRGRDSLRGGSSITQQLAKGVFNPNRSHRVGYRWIDKLKELVITRKLEKTYSKREILSLYVSSIRLGFYPLFGIKNAAYIYFGKQPQELNLREALFLCGLIPRPKNMAYSMFYEGKVDGFPVTTAWIKCVDLLRLLTVSFGWGCLDNVEELSFRDVEGVAREMEWYSPEVLPSEFELALEQRALIEVSLLKELIVDLSKKEISLFSRDALAKVEL